MFADPKPGGENLPLDQLNGHTVIVKPTAHEPSITTQFGDKDAIRVNVVSLNTGEVAHDVLWFSGGVIGSLKGCIGELVLARVAQGTPKPGQAAPWILEPMSQDAATVQAATAWVNANPGVIDGPAPTFTQPAATPAAPVAPAVPPIPAAAPQPGTAAATGVI